MNRFNLKIAFKSMDKKIKIPTRVGGTKWLPHTEKALKTLLSSYDAIVCHLEQVHYQYIFVKYININTVKI